MWFVTRSRFDRLVEELSRVLERERESLARIERHREYREREFTSYVERINKLGGEAFLQAAEAGKLVEQFTPGELETLRRLCSPERHGGRLDAVNIVKRLDKMLQAAGS